MKNYACAILLLMCVMSYSNCETYQDSGVVSINLAANCAYEGLFYTEGVHTLHQPCRVLKCYPDGDSIIEHCHMNPRIKCRPPGYPVIEFNDINGTKFPECCPSLKCFDMIDLPGSI